MKRFLALFIAAVLAVSVLTACGSEAQKSQSEESQSQTVQDSSTISSQENQKLSGKITVNTTHSNLVDTVLKDLAQKFMDENPGTEIVFQAIPDANQVLKIKMASSSLDDITMVLPETKSSDFEKYFVPLDDLGFTKDNLYFYETGLGTDGKLYKIDGLISYSGIAYNKKVFEECGITEVPKTWDDFYKVCEKIKAKGITPISTSFKDGWPLQFWTDASFPFQNTGNANYFNELTDKDEILSEDGGGNPEVDLMLTTRLLERSGIKTVIVTDEYAGSDGASAGLADVTPEADAVVTNGNGNQRVTLPPLSVIGDIRTVERITGGHAGGLHDDGSIDMEIAGIMGSTNELGAESLTTVLI